MRNSSPGIAIIRFGAAGDVLLLAPAIAALAAAWPQARLLLVTHQRFAALQAGHPDLHAIEPLLPGEPLQQLAARVRAHQIDYVLDLHGTLRARALAWLLRPKRLVRWRKRSLQEWAQVRLAHAPYRPQVWHTQRAHAAVETLVGRSLPLPPMQLHALPQEPTATHVRLDPAVNYVAISAGAGWATKRWPVARYIALAQALQARNITVILLGSPAEKPLTAQLAEACPGAQDFGGLGWQEMAALLKQVQVFVAGDTGPMHLARGLGTPTVALFGSTSADAFDFTGHAALQADTDCRPCSFYGLSACPRGHMACLTQLEVADVLAAVQRLLAQGAVTTPCRA